MHSEMTTMWNLRQFPDPLAPVDEPPDEPDVPIGEPHPSPNRDIPVREPDPAVPGEI